MPPPPLLDDPIDITMDVDPVEPLQAPPQPPAPAQQPAAATPASPPLQPANLFHATSQPMPIPALVTNNINGTGASTPTTGRQTRTPSPNNNPHRHQRTITNGHEGPITPRNDAGPWVFDGSGIRNRDAADPNGIAADEVSQRDMMDLDTAAVEGARFPS